MVLLENGIILNCIFDEEKNSLWMLPGYLEGISRAGGLPIILPLKTNEEEHEKICSMCDGFLFTGGQDVSPDLYGETASPLCGAACVQRDVLEKKIFLWACKKDIPVFGICRGIQLINVLLGGKLYQDLPAEHPSAICHQMTPPYDRECHKIIVLENTPLADLWGSGKHGVNSYHHQAVKTLAPCLTEMAWSEDGLIEAVCLPEKRFVWAVQWHPEFSFRVNEDSRKIFGAFVAAAKSAR